MTAQEKKKRIAELRAELRKLEAVSRSGWHKAFEALLRIETHKYGNQVHIRVEERIGEEPPRTDFVILVEDEKVEFEKAIFQNFRKINILEYKNPHDSLNERVLRKVCGYANLYISMAEHEGERPANEVTLSIFRAAKTPKLFSELERNGNLVRGAAGIYYVKGFIDLPFQIVITSELEGEEYTAYHALKRKADRADIERLFRIAGEETNEAVREHYRVLLNLVAEKNPQYIDIWRGEFEVRDVLMEIVQDAVEERVEATERETLAFSIKKMMANLKLTLEQAMDILSIPTSQRQVYASLVQEKMA